MELFSAKSQTSALKWLPLRKLRKMVEKIQESVSSEELGTLKRVKCRVNRTVICDLPPPGGAQAQIRIVLSISFQKKPLRS